jgi:hypothetical protein
LGGAKVIVNDLGAHFDGTGKDASPARQVVNEIKAAGGEAVAQGDSVSDFKAAKRIVPALPQVCTTGYENAAPSSPELTVELSRKPRRDLTFRLD